MEKKAQDTFKNRWAILFNVVMMTFMCCLDSSIVNVALPVMAEKFNVSMASIEWVVTSYLIFISATILIFGRLGDIKGKGNIFKMGVILFTIGSLLCGISNTLETLVFSRVIQAIGAAGAMATNQGIITLVFPSNERGRALGISATFVALGTMVGPPLGGMIISLLSWKYIFLINVPIGILTFLWSIKILPKDVAIPSETLDKKGSILFLVSIVLLFGALILGHEIGYKNPAIMAAFLISIIAFILFVIVEKRVEAPLLQLKIFENPLFSLSIFCGFISYISIASSSIIQPFYLQDVLKLSPGATGLFMMAYPLILSVVAPVSGHLSDKIGSEFLTFLGLLFISAGLLAMSTLNEHSSLGVMLCFVAIMAMGNGLFQSPNNSLVMSTVTKDKLGIAGSVNALLRNLGMILGVSLSTTILYNKMSYKMSYHVTSYIEGRGDVFVYGMRYVYISAAAICIIGALLTALRLYGSKKRR